MECREVDLTYQANGANQHRVRLLSETLGASSVAALDSSSKAAFSIWCDHTTPPSKYHVWWQNTSLESIDKIVLYAKQQINSQSNLSIVILEHSSQSVENITFFVVVSKDNVVRTFQNEKDVCLYLKELASKYSEI